MQLWRHTPKEIHLDWFVLSDLESFAHKSAHKDTIGEESAGYFTQPTKSVCLCVCGPVRLLVCHCVHLYNVFFSNIVHTEFKFHHFSQQSKNSNKTVGPKTQNLTLWTLTMTYRFLEGQFKIGLLFKSQLVQEVSETPHLFLQHYWVLISKDTKIFHGLFHKLLNTDNLITLLILTDVGCISILTFVFGLHPWPNLLHCWQTCFLLLLMHKCTFVGIDGLLI